MNEREAIIDGIDAVKDNCDDYLQWGEMKVFIDRLSHTTTAPPQELVILLESAFAAGYKLACGRCEGVARAVVYEANEKDANACPHAEFEDEFLNN